MKTGFAVLETKDVRESSRFTFEIPMQYILHALLLRLVATFTVTGGSGAGTIPNDVLHRFILAVSLVVEGQTVQTWSGQALRRIFRYLAPEQYEQTVPTSLQAGTAQPVELTLQLPFVPPNSLSGERFALPSPFGSAQLVVDLGPAAATVNGEDGAVAFNNARMEVTQVPRIDAFVTDAYDLLQSHTYTVPVTAASGSFRVTLNDSQPGHEISAVLIEAEAGGAGGAGFTPSDTVVRFVRFAVNGADVYQRTAWDLIRNQNKSDYALAVRESGAVLIDAAADKNHEPGELYTVAGGVKPFLELDVAPGAGETRLRITVISVLRAPEAE